MNDLEHVTDFLLQINLLKSNKSVTYMFLASENEDERLFQFEWAYCQDGYAVKGHIAPPPDPDCLITGERRDSARDIWAKSSDLKSYQPFIDAPGLAREFAGLKRRADGYIDTESAIEFAKKYGVLGLSGDETIEGWSRYADFFQRIFSRLVGGDAGIKEAMGLFNGSQLTPKFSVFIAGEDKGAKHRRSIHIMPQRLISAMWLMVAEELTKGVSLQACRRSGCSKWVTLRSNKKHCSNACRQAEYRARKLKLSS